jgi:hypothetical protein
MSLRTPPGIQCGSQFPASLHSRWYSTLGKYNSDAGASVQIWLSFNCDGGSDGAAFYGDGGDNNAYCANFVGGSANATTVLPSRPPDGTWCMIVLDIAGQGAADQRAAWINLQSSAPVWVSATCQALTSAQISTNNNQSLSSGSNQLNGDFEWWRGGNGVLTLAQYLEDAGTSKSRYSPIFDFLLPNGTTFTDQSGNGNTATSQGGANGTGDTYVYPRKSFIPRVPAAMQRAAFR